MPASQEVPTAKQNDHWQQCWPMVVALSVLGCLEEPYDSMMSFSLASARALICPSYCLVNS
jgi:hypothetical protein